MVGTLAYKKFKLEQWFPNISHSHTPKCCISRKKKNTWWSSDQCYKQTARKRQTMHPPDRYGVKIWKVNTLRWSKGHMWDNVTILEEHASGTPLENSGTLWGVRYTWLTGTGLHTDMDQSLIGYQLWSFSLEHLHIYTWKLWRDSGFIKRSTCLAFDCKVLFWMGIHVVNSQKLPSTQCNFLGKTSRIKSWINAEHVTELFLYEIK